MRTGFLLAVLVLAGLYSSIAFVELDYLSSAGRLGPGFFPRIIGASLLALVLYSLYADTRRRDERRALSPHWRDAALVALLSAAFIALLPLLGGLAAMVVFMAATLHFLNRGRTLQNVLIALLLPLSIYLLFHVWLKASMPAGLVPLPL
jgi:putative tricarboxylic transport membrane protein